MTNSGKEEDRVVVNRQASDTFDAIISIGSFEMIGEERPLALSEMIRVAKKGARIGIAEPMCMPDPMPTDIPDSVIKRSFQKCFSTLSWNCDLFSNHGLKIVDSYTMMEHIGGGKNIEINDESQK
jgi:ubiquinone/menaquinone biosynthesis C-methylase UbiE